MKKGFTLIIIVFSMLSVRAQGLNAIFSKAIGNGRSNNGSGSYSVQFSKKNVLVDDVLLFMTKSGYVLTNSYTTKRMLRFGYYDKAMNKVYFILESEIESYIAKTPQTNNTGNAVIYLDSKKRIMNDIHWSGSVKNGWISGNGIGYTKLDNNIMYIVSGYFSNGIPEGNCAITKATPKIYYDHCYDKLNNMHNIKGLYDDYNGTVTNYKVGKLNYGRRSLYTNGKYGFIDEKGDIIVSCKYGKIVQEFNNAGYAIVTDPSDDNQEIKINTDGTKLGYSDNQLRINEEKRLAKIAEENRLAEENRRKEEERIRKEEERRQRERERILAEARAEEHRQERIRNAKEGDKICYCQKYTWSRGAWIFKESGSYSMNIVCFVEKNVDNGERLQIRVGSVESTSREHYTTPEIDGIKYSKGDVIWIRPLENRNWYMQ